MEKTDEQLNSMTMVEIPFGIHQSVMRKINHQKIKPALIVAFALLVLNFLLVAWHINNKLIDADFVSMWNDFLDVFSFNFSFISTMVGNFLDIVPLELFLSAVLSLAGAIYLAKKINSFNFVEYNKYLSS